MAKFSDPGFKAFYPTLNKNDRLIIEVRDFEYNGRIIVKGKTPQSTFTVEAYRSIDNLPSATPGTPTATVNHTVVAQESKQIQIPVSGANIDRVTRVLMLTGEVSVEILTDTKPFRAYYDQPENPPRIA